jgi:hypothetical protein
MLKCARRGGCSLLARSSRSLKLRGCVSRMLTSHLVSFIRYRSGQGRRLKTDGSAAPIPVPRDLALMLSVSVQRFPAQMMVTNGKGGGAGPWVIDRAIRDARGDIKGLPTEFSFHDLRHYFASVLIASGADIKTVQARMRHASATTTLNTYAHLWPDADESTRAAIGAVIAARVEYLLRTDCVPHPVVRGVAAGQAVSRLTRRSTARTRTGEAGSARAGSRSPACRRCRSRSSRE